MSILTKLNDYAKRAEEAGNYAAGSGVDDESRAHAKASAKEALDLIYETVSEHPEYMSQAIELLDKNASDKAIQLIVNLATEHKDDAGNAIATLINNINPDAVFRVSEIVMEHDDKDTVTNTLEALAEHGGLNAFMTMRTILRDMHPLHMGQGYALLEGFAIYEDTQDIALDTLEELIERTIHAEEHFEGTANVIYNLVYAYPERFTDKAFEFLEKMSKNVKDGTLAITMIGEIALDNPDVSKRALDLLEHINHKHIQQASAHSDAALETIETVAHEYPEFYGRVIDLMNADNRPIAKDIFDRLLPLAEDYQKNPALFKVKQEARQNKILDHDGLMNAFSDLNARHSKVSNADDVARDKNLLNHNELDSEFSDFSLN